MMSEAIDQKTPKHQRYHRYTSHHDYELTSEEEEKFGVLFNHLDVNKDGKVDVHDLSQALHTMQVPQIKDHAKLFLRKTGTGTGGHIDFADFLHYMTEHEKKLRLLFRRIDTNQDGIIDSTEIVASFKELGIKIDKHEADRILNLMDKDGTLKVDWEEWREYLLLHPFSDFHDVLHYWRHATIIDIGENAMIPDDFTDTELQTGMWWRHLVAGGTAGGVSRTCTAPLDRLKVFMQVHATGTNKMSFHSALNFLYKEGGLRSFWRGNGMNVIKIAPESAIKFMAYEQIKRILKSSDSNGEVGIMQRMVAGSLAGATAQTVIYPMEVLKTRLALRKTGQYSGIFDCARHILKTEGVYSFYRGYVPNFLGILPYAGIDLAVYETLKIMYMKRNNNEDPGILALLVCGTTSSTCGQLASYPLALVRTKLQADSSTRKKQYDTMSSMFRLILRKDGITGLYRGLTPNFLKVAPAVSISYVVYENIRKSLGVTMT